MSDPNDSWAINNKGWEYLEVQNPGDGFTPPIGYTPDGSEAIFAPTSKTAFSAGNVLACVAQMGRGKSTAVRGYQKTILTGRRSVNRLPVQVFHNPNARILLLTANRMYAASADLEQQQLAAELRAGGYTGCIAGSYMTQDIRLDACQFVLCSLESLQHVEGQHFDVIILDEVGSLARLVGGGTMTDFGNVFLLRSLCANMGTRVLALDADLLFKMDSSEPRSVVEDFFNLMFPERTVLCAKLVSPQPLHLQRSVKLYFNHKACNGQAGLDDWLAGIKAAIHRWHATNGESGMLLIPVCTKQFGRMLCSLMIDLKAPFLFHHGDSNQKKRFSDFSNLKEACRGKAALIVTTVLAIGVDFPQDLKVAQVFAALFRMGCSFQQISQALMRARIVQDSEMCVLIECMPPSLRNALVQQGKLKAIVRPTYDESLKAVNRQRGVGMRAYLREVAICGGLPAGVPHQVKLLDDNALRVMAHSRFERCMQISDPLYAFSQLCKHHGWIKELAAAHQEGAEVDLTELDALVLSEDDNFDIQMSPTEKWISVIKAILRSGEDAFFDHCYGLATKQMAASNTLCPLYQFMVKAYWALKHIGYIPGLVAVDDATGGGDAGEGDDATGGGDAGEGDDSCAAASLLTIWLGDGSAYKNLTPHLELQAHCLVLTSDEVSKSDNTNRMEGKKRKLDPQLELDTGMKMKCIEEFGKILLEGGFRRPAQLIGKHVSIAQRFVDIANRGIRKTPDSRDNLVLSQLRSIKTRLGINGKDTCMVELVRAIAKAIALDLNVVYIRPTPPDGSARVRVVHQHAPRACTSRGRGQLAPLEQSARQTSSRL